MSDDNPPIGTPAFCYFPSQARYALTPVGWGWLTPRLRALETRLRSFTLNMHCDDNLTDNLSSKVDIGILRSYARNPTRIAATASGQLENFASTYSGS